MAKIKKDNSIGKKQHASINENKNHNESGSDLSTSRESGLSTEQQAKRRFSFQRHSLSTQLLNEKIEQYAFHNENKNHNESSSDLSTSRESGLSTEQQAKRRFSFQRHSLSTQLK